MSGLKKIRAREPEHRRTLAPVRRRSRLAGEEGRFWRRYDPGEKGQALKACELYDVAHKKKGQRNGPLGHVGVQVFKALWGRVRFRDGRLDPSIEWLMRRCRRSKDAIVRALAALKAHGFLDWLRRYVAADQPGRRGPQVKQTTNAYCLSLPAAARRLIRQPAPDDERCRLEARAAELRAYAAQADSPLARAMGALGRAVGKAGNVIPPDGLNPSSGVSRQVEE